MRRGGVISCVWIAFYWVNVGFVDVLITYGEYGLSFKGSW